MILVTGATGTVGRALVTELVGQGVAVRAVSRDPARADLPAGVEVVAADLTDPASVTPHLDGVDAVFLVWPSTDPTATASTAPELVKALALRVPRIVHLSASGAGDDPASHWGVVERAVTSAGVEWTILRPTGFAANTLMWADQIRAGDEVRWPYGEAARSLVHERDLAEVAAHALTRDGHTGARYELTGPVALTQREQVRAIGRALGRELRWTEMPRPEAVELLTGALGDASFAGIVLDGWARFVARPEPVTDTVERITGRPARPYAEWAAERVDRFR
ncbi:SDR family oxidoreductase [Micromonospora cathayae]|uniref:NAD(P)H-binding protein n=1 Tax=Micromonospora cathayae TaxID=3028804 RepID=A0ABY7ZVG5_9ACTN|nr:NAD(P)H-binding protein [Micromonospora sp. HUAS 3]WDZ86806.1 NAD(P)H-binding protein [Micromonospora sp. HUAS 3]